jgi:hypothetical protein
VRYVLIAHPALPFNIPVEAALPTDEVTGEVELTPRELERLREELVAATLEFVDRE